MLRIGLSWLLVLAGVAAGAESVSQNDCVAGGFRNSYSLIDVTDVGEVSRFFKEAPENFFEAIPGFSNVGGRQHGRVQYFDFTDSALLNKNQELYLAVLENLPFYRPDRREASYRDNNHSPALVRQFEVKQYNRRTTAMDRHELFGQIRRKDRPLLADLLATVSEAAPITLQQRLAISHQEIVYLTTHYGIAHGAITLQQFNVDNFGIPNTHTVLKFELFKNRLLELTGAEQEVLNKLYCRVSAAFAARFPHIPRKNWFGYADYHRLAMASLPSRSFLQRYPLLYDLGQIATLCIIGFLLLTLLLGRYSKRTEFRSLTRAPRRHRDA